MTTIEELKNEIDKINERNSRVESDKAWESSLCRKALIATFTYFSIGIYLYAVNITLPWINAIVPTVAFLLSTLTFPFFKGMWLGRYKNVKKAKRKN